jgi:GAF domain-containing protein
MKRVPSSRQAKSRRGASRGGVQPILDAVARTAARLCEASDALIYRLEGATFRPVARHGRLHSPRELGETVPVSRAGIAGRAVLERRAIHIRDLATAARRRFPAAREVQRALGLRTVLAMPLVRDGVAIGAILIRRRQVRPFTPNQIALLKTFADQAALAIEHARLSEALGDRNRALTGALEQQTATAEVLHIISTSPTELQPVLDTLVASAARICGAIDANLHLHDGESLPIRAHYGSLSELGGERFPINRDAPVGRAFLDRTTIHVHDLATSDEFPEGQPRARRFGFHTALAIPLLRSGSAIGVFGVRRPEIRPFTDEQIALLRTFADQAVIAIENVRLFTELQARSRELGEALDQQTATAEVLQAMSSSPIDIRPVFDAIARGATRLCDGLFGGVFLCQEGAIDLVAHYNFTPEGLEAFRRVYPLPLDADSNTTRAARERRPVEVMDAQTDPDNPTLSRQLARALGFRSLIMVPMLRGVETHGVIGVSRSTVKRFSEREVALLRTFADQAVIAIENVRLFSELRARNRELTEALEQQTATAEVLHIISTSPTELQPVLDTLVASAARVCGAEDATLHLRVGDTLPIRAHHGPLPLSGATFPIDTTSAVGRAFLERRSVHIHDLAVAADLPEAQARALATGFRTILAVPLLRGDAALGGFVIRRAEVRPFSDKQIALLQTFADQAVIAIENVRLFTELQARNRALTEALEQQTATSEILGVISHSQTDVQPVFDAIAGAALRLCGAASSLVTTFDGELIHLAAQANIDPAGADAYRRVYPVRPGRGFAAGRAILTGAVVQMPDVQADPEYEHHQLARAAIFRSVLAVPMLREGRPIGTVNVHKAEPGPFTDRQVELLTTFAHQAVIAIENARLFGELQATNRELREALEQQTATAEILGVISGSPTDVTPVFEAAMDSALRLCRAEAGILWLWDEPTGCFRPAAARGVPEAYFEFLREHAGPPDPATGLGRIARERRTLQVLDVAAEEVYRQGEPLRVATVEMLGARTFLAVPMLKEGTLVGTFTVYRRRVEPFSERQVALIQTFADQAVIAIENVRLFNELQARTAQLTRSVEELTALGEVGRALGSTLDLETVLNTIVARANQLAGTDGCSVFEYDEAAETFHLRATHNLDEAVVAVARRTPIRRGEGVQGRMAITRAPVQVADIAAEDAYRGPLRDVLLRAGTRAILAVPLLREDHLIGGLTVNKKTPGEFAPEVVDLLTTFATQSALAIQNARLFREIEAKGRELEVASRHKSQFLANMSHELRTPLNAIIGYTELIADGIYGEVPDKMREVLERVQQSGRHLLGLINDILDLSKIEAGQLVLALADYSMEVVVRTVGTAVEPLATEKKLRLDVDVAPDLPAGRGDERRLTQVLLNLAGNAIKFTEAGSVTVRAGLADGRFLVSVTDTGPGIPEGEREKIFEEFQQAESTTRRAKGGTGLGLAIARRIVAMHGGRLWVDSTVGEGSTFSFTVPVRVEQQAAVAPGRPAS